MKPRFACSESDKTVRSRISHCHPNVGWVASLPTSGPGRWLIRYVCFQIVHISPLKMAISHTMAAGAHPSSHPSAAWVATLAAPGPGRWMRVIDPFSGHVVQKTPLNISIFWLFWIKVIIDTAVIAASCSKYGRTLQESVLAPWLSRSGTDF